jgi:hypothetical protein
MAGIFGGSVNVNRPMKEVLARRNVLDGLAPAGSDRIRPDTIRAYRPDRSGPIARLDAAVRGFTDGATFGAADKIVAGLNTVIPLDRLTNPHIRSVWDTGSLADTFRANLGEEQGIAAADEIQNPWARGAGQTVGTLIAPMPGGGAFRAAVTDAAKAAVRSGIEAGVARQLAGGTLAFGKGGIKGGLHGLLSGDSLSIKDRLRTSADEAVVGATKSLLAAGGLGLLKEGYARLPRTGRSAVPRRRAPR